MIFIRPETDLDIVRTVYSDPELFERIREDDVKIDDFEINPDALYFRLETVHEEIAGIAQFEYETSTTLKAHCNVLQNYREQYAEVVGLGLLDWFVYEAPAKVEKLQVNIPTIYRDVIGFVEKFGFVHEGTRHKSIIKHTQLADEYLGGITRHEAFEFLVQRFEDRQLVKGV